MSNQSCYIHFTQLQVQWFSLLAVAMFYKSAVKTELVNAEPLLLGKHRIRVLGASGHSIFINWSINNLELCVFLSKNTLLTHIVDPLTRNPWPTMPWLTAEQAWLTHIFSLKAHHSFLLVGTLDSTSALFLEPF